jgi:hypothetical protein
MTGSIRLRQLVIAAQAPSAIEMLQTVLGLGDYFVDKGVGEFGLTNGVFAIGDQFLEIVVPVAETAPAQRFIDRSGEGGYMAIFQTDDLSAVRARAGAMGIRRVWDIDLEDIDASHLHPADMGAAIVSVDEARPAESWRWGGPDWQANASKGRLVGAKILAPEPEVMAQRWSDVLGAEVDGAKVRLSDAVLVFERGETERLAAFDLELPDADDVLARGREAGLIVEGRSVMFAGVELKLV